MRTISLPRCGRAFLTSGLMADMLALPASAAEQKSPSVDGDFSRGTIQQAQAALKAGAEIT